MIVGYMPRASLLTSCSISGIMGTSQMSRLTKLWAILITMCFCMVRQSASNLILSKRMFGWVSHDIIHRSPEGYRLEGKEKVFESVAEVIVHYQQFPITGDQILGSPADKQLQGMLAAHCINHSILSSTIIIMFFIVSLISRIETKGKKRSLESV